MFRHRQHCNKMFSQWAIMTAVQFPAWFAYHTLYLSGPTYATQTAISVNEMEKYCSVFHPYLRIIHMLSG